jgi:hypothetical protein
VVSVIRVVDLEAYDFAADTTHMVAIVNSVNEWVVV